MFPMNQRRDRVKNEQRGRRTTHRLPCSECVLRSTAQASTRTFRDAHGSSSGWWNGGVLKRMFTVCWTRIRPADSSESVCQKTQSSLHQSDLLRFCFVNQQPPHFHYEDFCFFIQNLKPNRRPRPPSVQTLLIAPDSKQRRGKTHHGNVIKDALRSAVRHYLKRKIRIDFTHD